VHLKLPSKQYDEVYEQAQRARVSVPEFVRYALARSLRAQDKHE
jgi:hypothetical protein